MRRFSGVSSRNRVALATILAVWALELTPASWADSDEVVFTDRLAESGIQFRHHADPTAAKYILEAMSGGVGMIDFNSDGYLDLYFVNGGRIDEGGPQGIGIDRSEPELQNRLYQNEGDGTFVDVTEAARVTGRNHGYGMGVAVGDFDNDGLPDLYVTNFGPNVLYRNLGDGTFRDVTEEAGVAVGEWTASAGFFDYDHDGDLDLFVVQYLDWDFSKHISCGEVYCPPSYAPMASVLLRNSGYGTFDDVSVQAGIAGSYGKGLGVAFNDYDGDGLVDVCVANDSVAQQMFRNNGDGAFAELALDIGLAYNEDGLPFSGMGIDFSDYNNDGRPDIVITDLAKELYALFRNDGGGTFSFATRTSNLGNITAFMSGWGARFFDYDHDGWKDLFVAQSHVIDNIEIFDAAVPYRQAPLLARNRQDGTFVDVSRRSGEVFRKPVVGRGAAFGDLDNDGDMDIVVGVLDDVPQIIYSDASESGNHWLLIRTIGTVSNLGGLGATVKVVREDSLAQWNYVTTAGSYLSANDSRVHFGMGDSTRAATVEIRWPSGIEQVIRNVRSNQILAVREPEAHTD